MRGRRVRWWPVGIVDPLQEMLAGTWSQKLKEWANLAKEIADYEQSTRTI
jgi:hypothetical protein